MPYDFLVGFLWVRSGNGRHLLPDGVEEDPLVRSFAFPSHGSGKPIGQHRRDVAREGRRMPGRTGSDQLSWLKNSVIAWVSSENAQRSVILPSWLM
jgi:hypothetical protein